MKLYLFAILVLFSNVIQAQKTKPLIGSIKGVNEAFTQIKKGLPDIKKNLTKKTAKNYIPKIKLGNAGSYKEGNNGDQSLTFTYSSLGYSGTLANYLNFYKTLISITNEIFGVDYKATAGAKEIVWTSGLIENGKNVYTSTIDISIKYDGPYDTNPSIIVEIKSERK